MNNKFSRRNFIQTTAVVSSCSWFPVYAGASVN